jgi:hypothetical protein
MKNNMNYNQKSNNGRRLFIGNFVGVKIKGYLSLIIERVKVVYVSFLASASIICMVLGFKSTDVLMGELYKGIALMACLLSIHAMSRIRSVKIDKKAELSKSEVLEHDFI